MKTIDLNADLGEGVGHDGALMALISSASIACGGHAGDATSIRRALILAKRHGVAVGAHPGFADKTNFGRRRLTILAKDAALQVTDQLLLFLKIAREEAVPVHYLKLHGALANMASEDEVLAKAVLAAVQRIAPDLAILALDHSAQVSAAAALGLKFVREAYADRAYNSAGLLVGRDQPGAVLADPDDVVAQCRLLAEEGQLRTIDGKLIRSKASSICVHGDTPGAVDLVRRVHLGLDAAGIGVAAPF